MQPSLLIIGASARAAAQSACRAGLSPLAADCFADTDLVACCPTVRVEGYPNELHKIMGQTAAASWMYTGALENYPQLVRRMERLKPLWGNGADVLERVRQPQSVAHLLRQHGLLAPELRPAECPPQVGRWLRKPIRSANGLHIEFYPTGRRCAERSAEMPPASRGLHAWYFQHFIEGDCHAAVFVAVPNHTTLLGVTRQLTGAQEMPTRGFRYLGSFGPVPVSHVARQQIEQAGRCLAEHFQMAGLFGIDVVLRDEEVWTLEVNPRYTASVEILERALSFDAVGYHVAACRDGLVAPPPARPRASVIWGKLIQYASDDLEFSSSSQELAAEINAETTWPSFADLPAAGTMIRSGRPIATAFACGQDQHEVTQRLDRLWAIMQPTFRHARTP